MNGCWLGGSGGDGPVVRSRWAGVIGGFERETVVIDSARQQCRQWVLQAKSTEDIVVLLCEQYDMRPASARTLIDGVCDEIGAVSIDIRADAPKHVSKAIQRLEMMFGEVMEQAGKEKKPAVKNSLWKTALAVLDRIHRIQQLEGPKSLVQVAIMGNGSTGPTPIDTPTQADLIAAAKAKGLPIPDDLAFQAAAIDAGRRGEVLVISPEDAKKLQGGDR